MLPLHLSRHEISSFLKPNGCHVACIRLCGLKQQDALGSDVGDERTDLFLLAQLHKNTHDAFDS
jgi:hypothetical protein